MERRPNPAMVNETKWWKFPFLRSKKMNSDKEHLYRATEFQSGRDHRRVQFGGNAATTQSDEEYDYDYDRAVDKIPNPYRVITQPKCNKAPQSLPGDMQVSRGMWNRASRRSSRRDAAAADALNRSFQSEFLPGPSTSAFTAENERRRQRGATARPHRHRVTALAQRVNDFDDESSTQSLTYYAEHDSTAASVHGRTSNSRRKILREEKEEIHWLRQQNYIIQQQLDSTRDKMQRKYARMQEKYQKLSDMYEQLLKSNVMKDRIITRLEGEFQSRQPCGYGVPPATLMPQNHGSVHTPQTHIKPNRGGGSSAKSGRQKYENHSSYVDSSMTGINDNNSVMTGASSIAFSEQQEVAAFQGGRNRQQQFRSADARAGSGESLAERSDNSIITGGTNTKTASNSTDVGNPNVFARPHAPIERRQQRKAHDGAPLTRSLHKESDSLPPGQLHGFNEPMKHLSMLSAMYPPIPQGTNFFPGHNPFIGAGPSSLPTKNRQTNEMFMSLNIGATNPMTPAAHLSGIPSMQPNLVLFPPNRDYDNLYNGNHASKIDELRPLNQTDDNDTNDEVKNFRTQNDSSIHDTDATEELERDKMLLANDSVNTSSGTTDRLDSDAFSSPDREETARGSSTNDSDAYYGGIHRGTDSSATITATLTEDSSSSLYESLVHIPFTDNIKYVDEDGISTSTSLSYRRIRQPVAKARTLHQSRSSPSMMYANIPIETTKKNRGPTKSNIDGANYEDKENRQPSIEEAA